MRPSALSASEASHYAIRPSRKAGAIAPGEFVRSPKPNETATRAPLRPGLAVARPAIADRSGRHLRPKAGPDQSGIPSRRHAGYDRRQQGGADGATPRPAIPAQRETAMLKGINNHIGANLWLWVGISAAVTVLAMIARNSLGKGYYIGEIITVSAMVLGTLLILISQIGYVAPTMPDEDD